MRPPSCKSVNAARIPLVSSSNSRLRWTRSAWKVSFAGCIAWYSFLRRRHQRGEGLRPRRQRARVARDDNRVGDPPRRRRVGRLAVLVQDARELLAVHLLQERVRRLARALVEAQVERPVGLGAEAAARLVELRRRDAEVEEDARDLAQRRQFARHRRKRSVVDVEARIGGGERLARRDRLGVHVERVQRARRRERRQDAARVAAAPKRRVDVRAARLGADDFAHHLGEHRRRVRPRRLQARPHARVLLRRRRDAQPPPAKGRAVPRERLRQRRLRRKRDPADALAQSGAVAQQTRRADHLARLGEEFFERLLRRLLRQVL